MYGLGEKLASQPVPGPATSQALSSPGGHLAAATAANMAVIFEAGLGCNSSRLEGGVWGSEAPPVKKYAGTSKKFGPVVPPSKFCLRIQNRKRHMAASILYPSITTRLWRAPRKLYFEKL